MAGRTELEFSFGKPGRGRAARAEDGRLDFLVVGDFSGREGAAPEAGPGLEARQPIAIDIDSFDRVLARLRPRADIEGNTEGERATLVFSSLEDFHPDALLARLPALGALRDLRGSLSNPATASAAAATLRRAVGAQAPAAPAPAPQGSQPATGDDDTLSRLLGAPATPAATTTAKPARVDLDAMLRPLVAPYVTPAPDAAIPQMIAATDQAIASEMRRVLSARAFRAVEALWRGVDALVRVAAGADGAIRIFLLDVSRQEMLDDLTAPGREPQQSALYKTVVERRVQVAGGRPWSAVIAPLSFAADTQDLALLRALGALAAAAGGPLLAAADPSLAGAAPFRGPVDLATWQAAPPAIAAAFEQLRRAPEARSICLALPRVLLRLPYGRKSDPVESFAFEELGGGPADHDRYLWGNPAFACAQLLAVAFQEADGGELSTGGLELGELPAHTFSSEGETQLQACAETYLPERAALVLLERGFVPLVSVRDRNAVRLLRLQSIANPPTPIEV